MAKQKPNPEPAPPPPPAIDYVDDDGAPDGPDEAELERLAEAAANERELEPDELEPTVVAVPESRMVDPRAMPPPPNPPVFDPDNAAKAVKKLDEMMRNEGAVRKRRREVVELPKMDPAEVKRRQPKRYRVLESAQVPRGASFFRLPAGKIIDDREYRIDELKGYGVKLRELDPAAEDAATV